MSTRLCRLGTVFIQACIRLVAKPSTWGTLLLVAFTAAGSISIAMLAPPFTHSAFGASVSFGAEPPSLSMCGSSEVVYVGDAITLPGTRDCSPLHLRIGIASPVTFNAPAPGPATDSTTATGKHVTGSAHGVRYPPSPATIVRTQINQVRQSATQVVSSTAYDIWLALAAWTAWALLWCLGASFVIVTAINLAIKTVNKTASFVYRVAAVFPDVHRREFAFPVLSHKLMRGVILACSALWIIVSIQAGVSSVGLTHDTTVSQVVGSQVIHLVPPPAGKIDTQDNAAVIGDSRAAIYGAEGSKGYCWQSTDSLANLLTQMPWTSSVPPDWHFLNLACSAATIPAGLLGPQNVSSTPDINMPAQVGRLKQMPNLRLVVVYIGANDVDLPGQAKACIGLGSCNNNISMTDFQQRLTMLTSNFGQLLQELYTLPTHPKVLVNLSYGAMSPSAAATKCLSAIGLSAQSIQLLDTENQDLNNVLTAGTAQFQQLRPNGFATADPQLTELCQPNGPEGPEIQSIWKANGQPNPFALHPTDAGAWAIAITDRDAIQVLESAGS